MDEIKKKEVAVLLTMFVLFLQNNGMWFWNVSNKSELSPDEIFKLKDQFIALAYGGKNH